MSYANVAGLIKQLGPLAESPQGQLILRAIGLSNVRSVGSVTGMDQKSLASKTWIAFDGEPTGLMSSLAGKPLTAADLSTIPRDATFAMALRLDPLLLYQQVVESASRANPLAAVLAQQVLSEMESTTGIRLINDVLKPLGDVWTIYNAPSAGGALFGGMAFTVQIRDRASISKSARTNWCHECGRKSCRSLSEAKCSGTRSTTSAFKGQRVFYLQFGDPFVLAPPGV